MFLVEEKLETVSTPEVVEEVKAEEPVEEAPKAKKEKAPKEKGKGLSVGALRFIYFGISLVLVALAGFLAFKKATTAFHVFGFGNSAKETAQLINNLLQLFNGGSIDSRMAIGYILIAILTIYMGVGFIVCFVYFIIMFVGMFTCLAMPKKPEDLEKRFHNVERKFVRFFSFFLIFDCCLAICGGKSDFGFVFEVVMLSLIFVGNSVSNALRRKLGGEHISTADFVYLLIEMAVVYGTLLVIYLGLTREAFGMDFYEHLVAMTGSSPGLEAYITMGARVVRLVGFFLALSIVKRVVSFYPYNDKKNIEKGVPYAINGILGKTIAALVIYVISGGALWYAGYYKSIMDALNSGPLVLIIVLALAITLRIAANANKPKEEEGGAEPEPEPEELPPVEPEPEVEPAK